MARDTSKLVTIPGELHSAATGNIVVAAEEVFDYTTNKYQKDINQEVAYIKEDSSVDPIPSFNPQSQTVHIDEQVLSNTQKKQVRKNIGLGNGDIDSTPTSGSDNVVRSGGVYSSMQELRSTVNPQVGYYICSTAGNTAAKVIDASGYTLLKGGGLRVNFTEKNTSANATLNIEQTGAKPLYYNGVRVSTNNSWYAGEIMTLFYDGAAFQLNSLPDLDEYDVSARNGGQAFTFEEAVALVPEAYRHGGLKLRFISNSDGGQSSDNKYVQYRLMKNTWSTTVSNWQGVDDEPITRSNNLVKSGGIAKMQSVFNVNLYNNVLNTPYTTDGSNTAKEVARLAVPTQFRKFGLIITYRLEDGWIIERNCYVGTDNIADDSIWKRDDRIDQRSWTTLVDAQDSIFNVNYHLLNNSPITMEEALHASLDTGMKTSARCISYLSEDGAVLAIFNANHYSITDVAWLNPENWLILGGYDCNASKLAYYEFNGTVEDVGVNTYVINKKPFSGTKVLINILSGDYLNIVIVATPLDGGNDIYYAPNSSTDEHDFAKEIKYIYVYVRKNSPGNYSMTISGGITLDVKQLQDTTSSVTEIASILQGDVETLEKTTKLLNDIVITEDPEIVDIPLTMHTVDNLNGFWLATEGSWVQDNIRRGSDKIDVVAGEKYLVTTRIGGSVVIGYLAQWNGATWIGVAEGFTGGSGDAVDKEYIVPKGVTQIAICSYNTTVPSLKKVVDKKITNFYTKSEADSRFAPKGYGKYGVKWSVSDYDDLGQRCFDAVGLTATIGEGNNDGSSDFDNIYPWSEMKRCNIKTNANGAKIVTFEGESGFALDGTNGDVFVRIPKFCVERYTDNGYEYRVVSRNQGFTHPAFIENGNEIDEIFIGAFEGYVEDGKLRSKAGVIPTSNIVAQDFLDAAQVNGNGFTLYDMRAVDAIWTLYAVEFGSRNTNQYLGFGFADFMQPVKASNDYLTIIEEATQTNSVKIPLMKNTLKAFMPVGSNITVCDTEQTNILTQAKILSVTDGDNYTEFTFDGSAINVTTNCFIGSAACTTNFAETCGSDVKLNWHTGRPLFVSGAKADRRNPVRYRWIENIIGSLWHFLPDVTFKDLQMYVCDNIKDYVCHKFTSPYRPVSTLLPAQIDNGQKNDNVGVNHWISSLLNDIFAKGNCFGKSFDDNLTCRKAFGGFYYLWNSEGDPYIISNGGGFDHEIRCNMLTNRAWHESTRKWYLYGARLMYKNID